MTRPSGAQLRLKPLITKSTRFWSALREDFVGRASHDDLPFKTTRKPPGYILLLHLVPVAGAAVIMSFNIYGYWIGKELSGINNQNAPKDLALQLTAKLLELIMLASLSEALLTHLLNALAYGQGLPFGSLTAVNKFKDISYVFSRDFSAIYAAQYHQKMLLVPLILICTIFGVALGPSSATALIPRLDIWPSGEALMALNTTSGLLWPSKLDANAVPDPDCNNLSLGCLHPLAWESIGSNFFSYWGHAITPGAPAFSPQRVDVPSIMSLRSMDIRLQGLSGSMNAPWTVAWIQHAVIGDLVNTFRFLTSPSRSTKCRKSWSPAMCSYQDVSWYVRAQQPVVVAACMETHLNTSMPQFPVIHGLGPLKTASLPISTNFSDVSQSQSYWTNDGVAGLGDASIAVAIKPGWTSGTTGFACTIQAQWMNSVQSTDWAGTVYRISGSIPALDNRTAIDKTYHGQTVGFSPAWAQKVVEQLADPQTNITAFDKFGSLGDTSFKQSTKLEAILSVLFAETMAHTGAGAIPLSITSSDSFLKQSGNLVPAAQTTAAASSGQKAEFVMKTSMNGYGYGLYTTSGLSISTLISIILLGLYSTFTLGHLVTLFVSKEPYIVSWREERDLLLTCLRSRYRPEALKMEDEGGAWTSKQEQTERENKRILKDTVIVTSRKGRAELRLRPRSLHGAITV